MVNSEWREKIVKPSQTKAILKAYGLSNKKRLGQNFLVDENILNKIVAAADLNNEDIVVEVGPGLGALTQSLAQAAGQVLAVEIDRQLVPVLTELFAKQSNVRIIAGDALKLDWQQLVQQIPHRNDYTPGFSVVANLPYYITTPLVMHCLEQSWPWRQMVLMVQKEVAQRMQATPGGKDYGALSVAVQYYAQAKIVTIVPPTAFRPPPAVESAVVALTKRAEPPAPVQDEAIFFACVKAAFGKRRKTLLNALAGNLNYAKAEWQQILKAVDIDGNRRGETLSIPEFASLANMVVEWQNR